MVGSTATGLLRTARRRLRVLLLAMWTLVSLLLALLSLAALGASIVESRYDPHFNRAPVALIVIAAVAAVVSLAALWAVVDNLRGARGGIGLPGGLALTTTAVALIILFWAASIATGPL